MLISDYLDNIMVPYKNVHGLDIAMNDLGVVQGLKALTDLHEILPDDFFWEGLLQLIPLLDESAQVSIWGILHHNAQQIPCTNTWSETGCVLM